MLEPRQQPLAGPLHRRMRCTYPLSACPPGPLTRAHARDSIIGEHTPGESFRPMHPRGPAPAAPVTPVQVHGRLPSVLRCTARPGVGQQPSPAYCYRRSGQAAPSCLLCGVRRLPFRLFVCSQGAVILSSRVAPDGPLGGVAAHRDNRPALSTVRTPADTPAAADRRRSDPQEALKQDPVLRVLADIGSSKTQQTIFST